MPSSSSSNLSTKNCHENSHLEKHIIKLCFMKQQAHQQTIKIYLESSLAALNRLDNLQMLTAEEYDSAKSQWCVLNI